MKKHIKQLLFPILILTALLSAALLVACGKHVHNYNYKTEVVEPTCVEGYTKHICKCGEFTTDTYRDPVLDHEWGEPVWEDVVPSTCIEEGGYTEVIYCTRCHAEKDRAPNKKLEKAPHTYQNGVCSVCTVKIEDNERIQSEIFEIEYVSPVRISANLPHDTESINLKTAFTSKSKITWEVYSDYEGKHPINPVITLSEGETKTAYMRLFYESAPDGYYTTCSVTVHRCLKFTYLFWDGDECTELKEANDVDGIFPPNWPRLPEREGYDFAYWQVFIGDTEGEPIFFALPEDFPHPFPKDFSYPKETIIFYAYYELKHYQINYVLNGGENTGLNRSEYQWANDSVSLSFYAPEKKGYAFLGWYQDAGLKNALEKSYSEDNKQDCWILNLDVEEYKDITLYAKWEIIQYKITYELNGGTNNPNNPETYTIETHETALLDPTREGYVFAGWYTDEEFTYPATQLGGLEDFGDKTFYAKWIEITTEDD